MAGQAPADPRLCPPTPVHPRNVSAGTRQQETLEFGAQVLATLTSPAACLSPPHPARHPSPAGLHLQPPAPTHGGPIGSSVPQLLPAGLKTGAEPAPHLVFIKAPRHRWPQARSGSHGIHPSLGSKTSHWPAAEACLAKSFRHRRLGAEGPPSLRSEGLHPPHEPSSGYITAPGGG